MKNLGKRVVGLFFVPEEGEPAAGAPGGASAAEAPSRASLDLVEQDLKRDQEMLAQYAQGGGVFDLSAVLRAGSVSPEEQDRVEKTLALLAGLPAATPQDVKRQIVAASLQAFGIPVDKILESALLADEALACRVRASEQEKAADLEAGNRRVSELNAELERIKEELRAIGARHEGVANACRQEQARIRAIPDFFGAEATTAARNLSTRLR